VDCGCQSLLHLVGCTIFANKSATSVNVFYLRFFVDLRLIGGYSWAGAALAHMYEQLGDCMSINSLGCTNILHFAFTFLSM